MKAVHLFREWHTVQIGSRVERYPVMACGLTDPRPHESTADINTVTCKACRQTKVFRDLGGSPETRIQRLQAEIDRLRTPND